MPGISEYLPGVKEGLVHLDMPVADLGDLLDANENEMVQYDTVTSAVNNLQVANAATGNAPALSAVGDDTNVNLTVDAKGTGYVGLGMASASGGYRGKRSVLASSGNTTMTSAMSGSVMLIDGASTDYALPAIGAGDVGMYFDFVSTIISTGTQTITAQAGDLLTGAIAIIDVGAAGTDSFSPDVSDDLIITLNGTTTGGVAVGSWCRLTAISATRWFVQGVFNGSGTLATPFS